MAVAARRGPLGFGWHGTACRAQSRSGVVRHGWLAKVRRVLVCLVAFRPGKAWFGWHGTAS